MGNSALQANLQRLVLDENAASMAEYALLLALIAVAAIGALQILSGQFTRVFERTGDALEEAVPASSGS